VDESASSELPHTSAVPDHELRNLARSLSAVFSQLHLLVQGQAGEGLAERQQVHLGVDPRGLPVVTQELPSYQLVDVQVALDAWATLAPTRDLDVIGVSGQQRRFHPLTELLTTADGVGVGVGPVDYEDLADSPDTTRSCVRFGMFLLRDSDRRAGVLLRGADPHGPMQQAMLEVVAADPGYGRQVLNELRELAIERSVLRGQVLALGPGAPPRTGHLLRPGPLA
jgi:cell division protease FtsH